MTYFHSIWISWRLADQYTEFILAILNCLIVNIFGHFQFYLLLGLMRYRVRWILYRWVLFRQFPLCLPGAISPMLSWCKSIVCVNSNCLAIALLHTYIRNHHSQHLEIAEEYYWQWGTGASHWVKLQLLNISLFGNYTSAALSFHNMSYRSNLLWNWCYCWCQEEYDISE